jgi:hypothetical protein
LVAAASAKRPGYDLDSRMEAPRSLVDVPAPGPSIAPLPNKELLLSA